MFPPLLSDLFDKNSSGSIDLNEFQQLFDYINQWKAVFESFDSDRSGRIEQNELNQGKDTLHTKVPMTAGNTKQERDIL